MSRTRLALCKILNTLMGDADFFADFAASYEKRLLAQKVIYLLDQRAGLGFKFPFSWYLAGPYSPSLTSELFTIANEHGAYRTQADSLEFTEQAAAQLNLIRKYLRWAYEEYGLSKASWLELLASIDYISRWNVIPLHEQQRLCDRLRQAKPGKFTPDQIMKGIDCLLEEGV